MMETFLTIVVGSFFVILLAECVHCAYRLIRRGADEGLDPMRAAVQRAARLLVYGSAVLLFFPILTYGGPMFVHGVLVNTLHAVNRIEGQFVMQRFAPTIVIVNPVLAIVLVILQARASLRLLRFPETERLGREMSVVPGVFAVQYLITRGLIVGMFAGIVPEILAMVAFLAAAVLPFVVLEMAKSAAWKARVDFRIEAYRVNPIFELIAVLAILGTMFMPALEDARF